MSRGRRLRTAGAACAILVGLLAARAGADDSSAGVILPGLRSEPTGSVRVASSRLKLTGGQVDVTLDVNVQPAAGAAVVLHMPRFGWLGEAEAYPDRHFPELRLQVDGAPATQESTFTARVGAVDVSAAIRRAGVDPFVIASTPPFVTSRAADMRTLEKAGAVEKYQDTYLAKWTAARQVRVRLNAGPHTVTLTYTSRPSFSVQRLAALSKPPFPGKYCLTPSSLREGLGRPGSSATFVVKEHHIPVGIDDRRPASIAVAVAGAGGAGNAAGLIALCGANGQPITGRTATAAASGRADAKGVVRIASIHAAVPPK